ncbi:MULTISPECIES: DUF6907 domain-containing protein [unclassified Streptomyces]|uniref:DUF6907 domain-containing protein n=1 Tax=unclassified Streptomyces TaxID=2593676 RepID=UPI003BB4DDB9
MRHNVQPVNRHFADEFPHVAAALAEEDGRPLPEQSASPDAPVMRPDALQVSQTDEALRRARTTARTHRVRVLDAPGTTLMVTCPEWCESDHDDDMRFGTLLEDFTHCGAYRSLQVDDTTDTCTEVLATSIVQTPFDRKAPAPYVDLQPMPGVLVAAELEPTQLAALAEQLRAHARALDEQAEQLAAARAQHAQSRRADHEGRWAR